MPNATPASQKPTNTIRVASLNLLNNSRNIETRVEELIKELTIINPDILCLQEVIQTETFPIIQTLANALGYTTTFHTAETPEKHTGIHYGNAILSKTKETHFDTLGQEELHILNPVPILTSSFEIHGHNVHIVNAHLAWGSRNSGTRTRQAEKIAQYALQVREADPQAVVIMTGDLNAVEESGTIRFLKGLEETHQGENTLWVDAWAEHGTPENAITSDPTIPLGLQTAGLFGITDASHTPHRRIDYIFSYEWCYGKTGFPLTYGRFADKPETQISDHFGIYSDILLLPKP